MHPDTIRRAKTAGVVLFVIAVLGGEHFFKQMKANELARSVPQSIRPFAQGLERSSCQLLGEIGHFQFNRSQPVPASFYATDHFTQLGDTPFPEFERDIIEPLRGFHGVDIDAARSAISSLRDADRDQRESVNALLSAISLSDSGDPEQALARFSSARDRANDAISLTRKLSGGTDSTCTSID